MLAIDWFLKGLRFSTGLPGHLCRRISLAEARQTVQRRLENRETNFLKVVASSVFENVRSPYRRLFAQAQCDYADLKANVRRLGLDKTLLMLKQAGVFIAFDEFKGRIPIVRNGREFWVAPEAFDNPFVGRAYSKVSSGSTGLSTRAYLDLDYLAAQASGLMLTYAAHGILECPVVLWLLPVNGIADLLRRARFGPIPSKWFTPTFEGAGSGSKYKMTLLSLRLAGLLARRPIPAPVEVGFDDAGRIASALARIRDTRGSCLFVTFTSSALRVSLAARDRGIDLSGVTVLAGGEPPTSAKVEGIRACGARWLPGYWATETGAIGKGCAAPLDQTDLHVYEDMFGVIQHSRKAPGSEAEVGALLFTTLMPSAPKVMINVEMDDYGVMERRHCGCLLGEVGYHTHLRTIQSFSKLCCEGMALMSDDLLQLLDKVLPERFGGSGNDYQLREEEDERGFTRLALVIDPQISIPSEQDVKKVVSEFIRRSSETAATMDSVWQQAASVFIRRENPRHSSTGKLLPLVHSSSRSSGTVPKARTAIPGQQKETS